ncbi:bifunctional alpha/beta hydrolase/OsmC family protein [Robiginitalea sp. M366]|uniref:bifunctional alpha/beta hydrolase/OsmC family protein n=1 Tax=Robiginitalea aestuariiviva TaxID=3036903 RepID=UPI00240DA1EB|nr:bifunctional alpha/beta hydrolase/OsmC family protein [Robiginitalea aestuariiviva]MDG1573417.1 bifunctional alpha/beta hydrolase/OsmC family protein [Robiginitalea aestuariiviva]
MTTEKITFTSAEGHELSGRLELPPDRHPHHYAVFAHCFTCSKDLKAAREVTRALSREGFGVLRFDFTGLGSSEGDFAATNFSGNVEDLLAAAAFLEREYQAPALLVGHSLGGTAVLSAAFSLPSVKAVATVGAPAAPAHVTHLFRDKKEVIEEEGSAEVQIGGRPFRIRRHFLEDLEQHPLEQRLGNLEKALLFLHSPQDTTVEPLQAERLYKAARHPKSFISLDGADHLLSRAEDAAYAGRVIAGWASRYLPPPVGTDPEARHHVVASLDAHAGFTTEMRVGRHQMTADEPESFGGDDFGPSPYQLVSAGLSACTAMTLQLYARRKGWDLQNVEVHTSYSKDHAEDSRDCQQEDAKIDTFRRSLRLTGNLDASQRQRLLEIAEKCPVHRTLTSPTQVLSSLEGPGENGG